VESAHSQSRSSPLSPPWKSPHRHTGRCALVIY
jgi:hypothetical protein